MGDKTSPSLVKSAMQRMPDDNENSHAPQLGTELRQAEELLAGLMPHECSREEDGGQEKDDCEALEDRPDSEGDKAENSDVSGLP